MIAFKEFSRSYDVLERAFRNEVFENEIGQRNNVGNSVMEKFDSALGHFYI